MNQCKRKAIIDLEWWQNLCSVIQKSESYYMVEDVAPELLVYTAKYYGNPVKYKWYCENCAYDNKGNAYVSSIHFDTNEIAFINAIHHIEVVHPEHFFHGLYDE